MENTQGCLILALVWVAAIAGIVVGIALMVHTKRRDEAFQALDRPAFLWKHETTTTTTTTTGPDTEDTTHGNEKEQGQRGAGHGC